MQGAAVHRAPLQKKGARAESERILSPDSGPQAINAASQKPLSGYRYSAARFLIHPSYFPCASLQANHLHRRLRPRRADARFNRPRPEACGLSGLFALVWAGSAKQVETDRLEPPHNRRRNRALQERRARGAHTFAAPTTNRDQR
jgi:hypothetical protein